MNVQDEDFDEVHVRSWLKEKFQLESFVSQLKEFKSCQLPIAINERKKEYGRLS